MTLIPSQVWRNLCGRWSLSEGTALIREGEDDDYWLKLEDGIQIQFQQLEPEATYRTGDYWLIPARTATGDVEWPEVEVSEGKWVPVAEPPHGVTHHYAPLAIISVDAAGVAVDGDCRRCITEQTSGC